MYRVLDFIGGRRGTSGEYIRKLDLVQSLRRMFTGTLPCGAARLLLLSGSVLDV